MNNTINLVRIDYTTLVNMIEKEKRVIMSYLERVVQDLIRTVQQDEFSSFDENETGNYEESVQYKLSYLAKYFNDSSLRFHGRSDLFHNLAVDYARQEMNNEACVILKRGITLRPDSTDLLADFLLYGREIPEYRNDCKQYYNMLSELPRSKWSWRAFSFSISYLLEERYYSSGVEDEKKLKSEALKLSKEFVARFNKTNADQEYVDRAYSDMASVYKAFGDLGNEYKTLKFCTEKYPNAPIAALRLADIEFSIGDYVAAIDKLNISASALSLQPSVNEGYIYLLRAFCRASSVLKAQLNNKSENETLIDRESIISAIHRDLDTAEPMIENPTYEKAIKKLRTILEKQIQLHEDNQIGIGDIWT